MYVHINLLVLLYIIETRFKRLVLFHVKKETRIVKENTMFNIIHHSKIIYNKC